GGNGDGDRRNLLLARGLAKLKRVRIALRVGKAERNEARGRGSDGCPHRVSPVDAHSSRSRLPRRPSSESRSCDRTTCRARRAARVRRSAASAWVAYSRSRRSRGSAELPAFRPTPKGSG